RHLNASWTWSHILAALDSWTHECHFGLFEERTTLLDNEAFHSIAYGWSYAEPRAQKPDLLLEEHCVNYSVGRADSFGEPLPCTCPGYATKWHGLTGSRRAGHGRSADRTGGNRRLATERELVRK